MSSTSPKSDENSTSTGNDSPALDRGRDALAQGNPDLAILEFTRLIVEQPTNSGGYLGRGVAHRRKGKFAEALLDYNKAIEIEPCSATYLNRGNVYGHLQRNEEAVADFNQAIALKDENCPVWPAYKSRADCFFLTSRFEEALADYLEVVRLNPEFADAYHGAARIWAMSPDLKLRNSKLALEYAAKACEVGKPPRHEYVETWIVAFIENGNFNEAINVAEALIKKEGLADKTRNNAINLWIHAHRKRAGLSIKCGDFDNAIADLTLIISVNPEDADAFRARSIAYRNKGDEKSAVDDIAKATELAQKP